MGSFWEGILIAAIVATGAVIAQRFMDQQWQVVVAASGLALITGTIIKLNKKRGNK